VFEKRSGLQCEFFFFFLSRQVFKSIPKSDQNRNDDLFEHKSAAEE